MRQTRTVDKSCGIVSLTPLLIRSHVFVSESAEHILPSKFHNSILCTYYQFVSPVTGRKRLACSNAFNIEKLYFL